MTPSLDRKIEASKKRAEQERKEHPGLFGGKVDGATPQKEYAQQVEPPPKPLPPKGQR